MRAPTTAPGPTETNGPTWAVASTRAVELTAACGEIPGTAAGGGLKCVETLAKAR